MMACPGSLIARGWMSAALLILLGLVPARLAAEEPLHQQVDRLVSESPLGLVAEQATDGEFLRRVSLALIGRIPSAAEARQFLDDQSPDKRKRVIDRLLGGPDYVRHMTSSLDIMLLERRGDGEVKNAEWRAFLKKAVAENRPWNELAAEMFANDGTDAKNRGPAKFVFDRSVEANQLTREVGRMFFGMDVQCAQCHNHPVIDDYLQSDYYGIYAFLSRTYIFKPDKKKPGVLAENPTGDVSFKSVFTGDAGKTRPRLPGGTEIDEPKIEKGKEYKVKPDKKKKNLRPIPTYSRRAQLARLFREGKNRPFARNMANRLWAHMMGRGLVEPVDLHHSDNPPSHPELLEVLTDRLMAMKYDLRGFVRELALTRTFGRSTHLPGDVVARSEQAVAGLVAAKKRHGELTATVEATDNAIEAADVELTKAGEAVTPVAAELKKADEVVAAAKKVADPATKALADAQAKLTARQRVSVPLAASAAGALAAAKLLPADKELVGLAASLDTRSKKIAAEVAAIEKDRAAKQKTARDTGKKLAAATDVAGKVRGRHDVLAKIASVANDKVAALNGTRLRQYVQANVAARHVETLKALVEYRPRRQAADASQTAFAAASTALEPVQREYNKARAVLDTQNKQLTAAVSERDKTTATLAVTRGKVAKLPGVTESVGGAAEKSAQALKQLGDDKELAAIASILKARSDSLNSELAAARKALPGQEAAAKAAAAQADKAKQAVDDASGRLAEVDKRRGPLAASTATARTAAENNAALLDETFRTLSKHWSEQFAIAALEPLNPEQMGWSVLEATGMTVSQRAPVTAELDKKSPLKPEDKKDPAKLAARERQIDQAVYDKLKGNVDKFVKLFGASAGQPQYDFFATTDQALFFANGGEVQGWLAPGGGNLTDRLVKMADDGKLVEEVYLSVLTRRPTDDEVAEVVAYLAERTKEKRAEAIKEVVWALLTSAEFRFNH